MPLVFDTSRFEARLAAASAALRPSLADRLPLAATDLLLRTAYLEPIDPETQGADVDAVLGDVEFTGEAAAQVGIVQLYDWVLSEDVRSHCEFCPPTAEGGPYTADFDYRPETAPTHSAQNPCHCIWAPREPDLVGEAPAVLAQLGADVRQDLAAAWRGA